MTRIDLPEGQWAELADPHKVTERKRRPYVQAMVAFTQATARLPVNEEGRHPPESFGPDHNELFNTTLDLLTMALLKAWSFDLPLEMDALQDLPGDAFDVLRKAVGEIGPAVLPDLSTSPDPKVPSVESSPPLTASLTGNSTSATP